MATAATVLVAAGAAPVVTGPVATAQAAPRDTTPPSVPGNFRTTGSTPTSVSLAWTASTDNKGVAGYRLTRTNADGGGVVVRNIGTATSYTDNGLNSGWTYVYSLQALDAAGNASGSTSKVTVVVPASQSDTTPPSVPANFRTTGSTPTSVALGWTASTDDRGVAGYRLTRTHADGGGGVVRDVGNVTSYTDNGLNSGWTYVYSLQAVDAAGNVSGSTSKVTVLVPSAPASGGGTDGGSTGGSTDLAVR